MLTNTHGLHWDASVTWDPRPAPQAPGLFRQMESGGNNIGTTLSNVAGGR